MIGFYFTEEESSQGVSDQIPGDRTDDEVSSEEQPSSSEGKRKCL
jgi:hypothetical protein